MNRLYLMERQLGFLAPDGKAGHGNEIRLARIPVPDVRREELPEALRGVWCPQEELRQTAAVGAHGGELSAIDRHEVAHGRRSFENRPCKRRYPNSAGSMSSITVSIDG